MASFFGEATHLDRRLAREERTASWLVSPRSGWQSVRHDGMGSIQLEAAAHSAIK